MDWAVYRWGGQAVLDGDHLYDLRFPGALAFTYPPISALLFTCLLVWPRSEHRRTLCCVTVMSRAPRWHRCALISAWPEA